MGEGRRGQVSNELGLESGAESAEELSLSKNKCACINIPSGFLISSSPRMANQKAPRKLDVTIYLIFAQASN
jgi:hypothetical protein